MEKIIKNKKGLYIRNIEGLDAYKLSQGEKQILTRNWTGYIPFSLELLKLVSEGVKIYEEKVVKILNDKGRKVTNWIEKDGVKVPEIKPIKRKSELEDFCNGINNKSLDIINVNFRCSYNNEEEVIKTNEYKKLRDERNKLNVEKKALTKQLTSVKGKIKRLEEKAVDTIELKSTKEEIITKRTEKENKILEVKAKIEDMKIKIDVETLRTHLYENGFNDENGIKFVLWKRSGSKSRQGKVMFIREELSETMLNWGRMFINFPLDKLLDLVGIGAYSSLVSSAIEDIITINPDNILIVDEINSTWTENAKKVVKGDDGHLKVIEDDEMELESCATDGSSLLDVSCFEDGVDFKLLRNHMFKSCAFKCSIQLFYQDYCDKKHIDYNTLMVEDIYGNKMLAKNVKLIITKNSLKAFKFSSYVADGTDKEMYTYWKEIVKSDNNVFGICKHNHSSKWNFNGLEYNQMSYQMINSMNFDVNSLKKITEWERNYVLQLKNDINVFKSYLTLKANIMNCNKAMVAMVNKTPDFEHTELFRTFRTKTINKYMDKLRGGKIKNVGDYCTMIANPISYLKQSVGEYDEDDLELKDNQISTKLFDYDQDLICFRNPHVSQANVYIGHNTYNEDIDRYFNFGRNIVVVNCIKNAICQIMQSCDWDSDSCLIFDNRCGLVDVGKECYGHYKVIENGIDRDPTKYELNNINLADVDNKLSKSKFTIGRITNIAQLAMSRLWDKKNNGASDKDLKELQEIVDVMSILCGIAIDNAKKTYAINLDEEIEYVVEKLKIDKKPLFWRYVSNDKRLNTKEGRAKKLIKFETSMDRLSDVLKVSQADSKTNIDLKTLLVDNLDENKADRKQQLELIEGVEKLDTFINGKMDNKTKENEKDTFREIDKEIEDFEKSIAKKSFKPTAIYAILLLLNGQGQEKKVGEVKEIGARLLNILYRKNHSTFLSVFK